MLNNAINPNKILPEETFLVCICNQTWKNTETTEEAILAPVYGEVVTYDGEATFGFFYLKEYDIIFSDGRMSFDKTQFRLALEHEIKAHTKKPDIINAGEFVSVNSIK